MTKTALTIEINPPGSPDAGKIELTLDGQVLEPCLYDHWRLAGSRLRSLAYSVIPEGNFVLWHRWSLQCDRDPISSTKAHMAWEGLPEVEVPSLHIRAKYWPTPAPSTGPTQPVLAATTRNAVAQILDKYTFVSQYGVGGDLVITDVAELQRELVELVEAVKG